MIKVRYSEVKKTPAPQLPNKIRPGTKMRHLEILLFYYQIEGPPFFHLGQFPKVSGYGR